MYSYRESVKSDIRGWMEDNRSLLESEDRETVWEIVYDGIWESDSVTGNASGSYTFSRYEARRNFFEDEDSDEYISRMIEEGFTTSEEVGKAISESNWELLDVSIRCYLCGECLNEVLDEVLEG